MCLLLLGLSLLHPLLAYAQDSAQLDLAVTEKTAKAEDQVLDSSDPTIVERTERLFSAEATESSPPASEENVAAKPDRPLDLPSLPGMMPVDMLATASTEEENEAFLAEKGDWHDVAAAPAVAVEGDQEQAGQKEGPKSFAVRYALRPNMGVQSIPMNRVSREALDRQQFPEEPVVKKERPAPKKPKVKATPEACEALADMRRRELEAIESDRQTLSALKNALSQLGLNERLGFMEKGETVPAPDPALAGISPSRSVSSGPETKVQ